MRIFASVVFTFFSVTVALAEESDFNQYVIRAYKKLSDSTHGRLHLGYNRAYWYTRNLDYGAEKGVIKAKDEHVPYTMCNAAVTETIIEALNEYAKDHAGWTPQSMIPTNNWNEGGFTNLQAHLFGHELAEYPPLNVFKDERRKEIPSHIIGDARNFDSSESMAKAFETLGLGRRVRFEDAKPGDVISISRGNDYSDKKDDPGNGHSAIFLAFIDDKLNLTQKYGPNIRGFRYFSSQGDVSSGGLGEKSGFFRGFCPLEVGYALKSKSTGKPGCEDRVVSASRTARTPYKPDDGEKTDCCVNNDRTYGPKVGRLFSPTNWTYLKRLPKLEADYQAVKKRIRDWYENRGRASQSVALLAEGATALALAPDVQSFLKAVRASTGIDMLSVHTNGEKPDVSVQQANTIRRLAPTKVILAANQTVTREKKERIAREVGATGSAALARLDLAEQTGVPNFRFDGVTR